jgi:hypothetical protein
MAITRRQFLGGAVVGGAVIGGVHAKPAVQEDNRKQKSEEKDPKK